MRRLIAGLTPVVSCLLSSSLAAAQPCALTVQFGSYAMGIDRAAAAATERLVSRAPGITAVTRVFRGREGEYALCVETASAPQAASLAAAIRRELPAKPRGPIIIAFGTEKIYIPSKERPLNR